MIDSEKLFDDFIFNSTAAENNNYVGFRAWESSGATFSQLNIS
jgi:hypothetical protein